MRNHIIVVGSLNMDLVVHTNRHPKPGETLLGSNFQTFPGGKGANQAVAAARAGGQVCMIGRVGDDAFGNVLLENITRDGIDASQVRRTPQASSGVALITLDAAGQNTIVVASGANGLFTPQDVLESESVFENAAALLLQLETPLDTVAQAVNLARKYNIRVILNPAPARILPSKFLAEVDYLIPNENELAFMTGVQGISLGLDSLSGLVGKAVIVTLGGNGVMVADRRKRHHLAGHTVNVIDTVAAGDAFVGAFAVALAEGKNALDAAAFGNAAGAITVTRAGAQPSIPTRSEINKFLGISRDLTRAV